MTPEALAKLHARASDAPWPATSFAELLGQTSVFLCASEQAFSLGRHVLDEAELLQIATAPEAQRKGFGRAMLDAFEQEAHKRGARRAFLEVAADNTAARALYLSAGWQEDGIRRNYYRAQDGSRTDAVLMSKAL